MCTCTFTCALQALEILPASTKVSDVVTFLENVLEERAAQKRNCQVLKSLYCAEHLQVRSVFHLFINHRAKQHVLLSKTTCIVYLESFRLCYFFIINHIQHPLHAECHLNHGPLVYIVLTLNPLMATIVIFNPFYLPIKSLLLGTKCV